MSTTWNCPSDFIKTIGKKGHENYKCIEYKAGPSRLYRAVLLFSPVSPLPCSVCVLTVKSKRSFTSSYSKSGRRGVGSNSNSNSNSSNSRQVGWRCLLSMRALYSSPCSYTTLDMYKSLLLYRIYCIELDNKWRLFFRLLLVVLPWSSIFRLYPFDISLFSLLLSLSLSFLPFFRSFILSLVRFVRSFFRSYRHPRVMPRYEANGI